MLNTFHKLLKLSIIFTTVITFWTSLVFLSNSTFNLEIQELLTKMYLNQKDFIFNVKDLSIILVKDAHYRFAKKSIKDMRNNNLESD